MSNEAIAAATDDGGGNLISLHQDDPIHSVVALTAWCSIRGRLEDSLMKHTGHQYVNVIDV